MTNEDDDRIAAGIFRGEGTVYCTLVREKHQLFPVLKAGVDMCDLDSVELVARAWGSRVYPIRGRGRCQEDRQAWITSIGGIKVVEKVGGWIARGWVRGEKADEYFGARAKFRRARRVFLTKGWKRGRPRILF